MSDVNVLFFTISLGKGGAEMHLLRVLNRLDREGFTPSLAVVRGGGSYERELRDDVPVHYLPTGGIDSTTLRLVRAVRPLRRLIQREQPDIVCSVMDAASIVAARALQKLPAAARPQRPRQVASVQIAPVARHAHSKGAVEKLRAAFRQHLAAWAYRAADHVVAISGGVAEEVATLAPAARGRISVIHNAGVDEVVQSKADEAPPLAEKGEPLIVGCGRLTEQKGFCYLLDALAAVRRRLPARLIILGEGPLRPVLEAQVERLGLAGAVELPGFVDNPYRFMAAADVFVLSSLWEGFGNVVAEAMACGAPVVTTDCPHGPAEIVEGGRSGRLVPPGDAEALAEALCEVLTDDGLRQRLSAAGRERAQDFTAAHIAEQHGSLFRRVLGEASPVSTITG